MPKNFIFTMTPGRTGTSFLATLLKENIEDAEVHHEILGYDKFGIDTPDLSHFTLFNSQGNVVKVADFWRNKLRKIASTKRRYYVETSHVLMKAGLIENINELTGYGNIYLIVLKRDILKTVLSYRNRFDFMNKGNMWMWYLDPDYPRNLLQPKPFLEFGLNGVCLWYIYEIYTRIEFYRMLLKGDDRVKIIDIRLEDLSRKQKVHKLIDEIGAHLLNDQIIIPPPQNVGGFKVHMSQEELDRIKMLIEKTAFDPQPLAEQHLRNK